MKGPFSPNVGVVSPTSELKLIPCVESKRKIKEFKIIEETTIQTINQIQEEKY